MGGTARIQICEQLYSAENRAGVATISDSSEIEQPTESESFYVVGAGLSEVGQSGSCLLPHKEMEGSSQRFDQVLAPEGTSACCWNPVGAVRERNRSGLVVVVAALQADAECT